MTIRNRVWEILEVARPDDRTSRAVDLTILSLIVLNVAAVILASVEGIARRFGAALQVVEIVSVVIFSVEYLGRLWSATSDPRFRHPITGRMRYAALPMPIIDLLAVLPFYLPMIGVDLRFVRILRVMRVARLLEIGRYASSLRIMLQVIRDRREGLVLTTMLMVMLLVVSSCVLYYTENQAQPDAFPSIPATMWWAIATLTTVGYGDVTPITPLGKLFASVIAVPDIGMFALLRGPSGRGSSSRSRRGGGGARRVRTAASRRDELAAIVRRSCPHEVTMSHGCTPPRYHGYARTGAARSVSNSGRRPRRNTCPGSRSKGVHRMTRGFLVMLSSALGALAATSAGADLIITEVVDGTLTGGQPKWVELTNVGPTTLDLSSYSLGNFNNGSTTLGAGTATILTGQLGTCERYVVSYDAAPSQTFQDVYGFDPDFHMGGGFFNGDDVLALFLGAATGDGSDAVLVDVYGEIGTDGTGQAWEYTDSYSTRHTNSTTGSTTWNAADWIVAGPDALEDPGGDDAIEIQNLRDLTTPDVHECNVPVPVEPASWGAIKAMFVL